MASIELINELLESGVHYGHQTKRWNPKMREFILEEKNDIYIIDVSQTVEQLDRASKFLAGIVSGGGKVLLKPASPGTGIIAGGAVRAVVEAAGVRDILAKSLGSKNPANVVKATLSALTQMRTREQFLKARGKFKTEKA